MPAKILLVEDHTIVRQGIKSMLEMEFGLDVIGEASNGNDTIEKIDSLKPDMVLIALNVPFTNSIESARKVRVSHPDLKLLVLSSQDNDADLLDMFDIEANGYILNSTTKEELIYAINKIILGGIYIDPQLTIKLLAGYKRAFGKTGAAQRALVLLTDREKDVLKLIAEGLTNIEMSRKLFTSVRTIETRRKSLLNKTGTTNTATLIKFAVQNGLLDSI